LLLLLTCRGKWYHWSYLKIPQLPHFHPWKNGEGPRRSPFGRPFRKVPLQVILQHSLGLPWIWGCPLMLRKMGPSRRSQFRRRDWGYNHPNVGSFGSTFTLFIRRPHTSWITAPGERNDPPRTFSWRWNHVFHQVSTPRCSSLTTPCSDPRCLPRTSQSFGARTPFCKFSSGIRAPTKLYSGNCHWHTTQRQFSWAHRTCIHSCQITGRTFGIRLPPASLSYLLLVLHPFVFFFTMI